jgi:hypothetical protein
MKVIKYFILVISTFLLFNCVSLMEKTGRVLDGSAFKLKTVSVYKTSGEKGNQQEIKIFVVENKDKEKSIIITLENFPMMKLFGSFPDEEGVFTFTTLEFLAGNANGWNEYTMELIGTGNLNLEDTVILKIDEIEPVQITKGRVQLYDTRLTGNEALSALRNRRERLLALTDWMSSLSIEKGKKIDDFERFWQPILLPETVSRKKRPNGWIQDADQFQKTDGIRWNISYTERTFSEELWPIRNSGTLLRDWEEAIGWIHLEYEWKNIVELLLKETIFIKIK